MVRALSADYKGCMPSPASSRLPLAALFALVLLGAAMRLWQARESLWLDELHTAWCAMGSLAEVAPRATIGNQSPLFFWIEWLLVQVLGPSELAVRIPSLVAGSLLPVALHGLIQRWTREPWLGVLAAWLVVVDPIQIFYATEARPYALVQLLAVIHMALIAEILSRPSLRLHVAFILIGALLFHLHYTAALLFPAEIAAIVIVKFCEPDRTACRCRSFAALWLLIALLCLPALPNLLAIYSRRTNWEAFVPQPSLRSLVSLLPWSWTALIVLVGQASRLSPHPPNQVDARPSILALCWLLVPLVLAWLLTVTDVARLFFLRYLIAIAPAAIVLAILAVWMVPWRQAKIAVGLAVALAALNTGVIPQLATDGRLIADRHGDWRSAIAHFNRQPDHDHYPLLLTTQLIESDALRGSPDSALREYCLFPVHSLYPIAADPAITIPLTRTSPGQLAPEVRDLVRSRGVAWIIVGGSEPAVDAATQQMLVSLAEGSGFRVQRSGITTSGESGQRTEVRGQQDGWRVVSRRSFGTVHVVLLRQL